MKVVSNHSDKEVLRVEPSDALNTLVLSLYVIPVEFSLKLSASYEYFNCCKLLFAKGKILFSFIVPAYRILVSFSHFSVIYPIILKIIKHVKL